MVSPLKENPRNDQDFLAKPTANEQQGNRVALPLKENPLNDRDFLAKPRQERESLTVGLHLTIHLTIFMWRFVEGNITKGCKSLSGVPFLNFD